MDTRAPPIASRTTQDRCCQQLQQQQQQPPASRHRQQQHQQQQSEQVTLPPLASSCPTQRQRAKFASAPAWRNGAHTPGLLAKQELQRRRPYKVLGIGATPLMHACQQADRGRVLKLLREQEETIGYRDRALRSALHYCMDASTGGALAQAAPELVNSPDAEGHTPLHLAVIAGDHQLVAVLLANGADVNAKDLEGHSVLHWATVCGEVECARLVLAAGARPSSPDLRGGSPLHYAAQCCGAAATAELAVPKKVGLKVLQTLLEFGADVNARDEDGRQPILWAASAGSVEAVLALVRAGGSAVAGASDKDGLTALHCAASRGHARCIEALVTLCDAQPDHVDDNGCSALHYAATLGHADATSLLLKLGADPNRQDRKGRTPALCAAAKGQLETLKILAQHGGSLHARTIRGTGVAHEAVASGRLELIKWLARKRPGLLDVATPEGKTPLHVAALHGHLDACKLLLDNGSRINALLRTSKGALMTALDAALYRGHRDCAKLIQLHGGTTAQHLKSDKPGPTKVFSTRLRLKHLETSSDSELNDASPRQLRRRQHRHVRDGDPEMFYEERYVERRTRRRANRRRLSRQDSRSFSEEELRHSKASTKTRSSERQRRALSENARYDEQQQQEEEQVPAAEAPEGADAGSRRRRTERQSRRQRRNEEEGKEKEEQQPQEKSKPGPPSGGPSEELSATPSDEESSSVSDDSLEVLVVKRSLERMTSEKIVSGRKSRTPRDGTTKDSGRSAKSETKRTTKELETRIDRKTETTMTTSHGVFDGDSTSQDTVEQVTITADVHKNAAPDSSRDKSSTAPDSSRDKSSTAPNSSRDKTAATEEKEPADATVEQKSDEQMRSKMDDILEKADELQNALLTKAADLKKDMEEMRHQMNQKVDSFEKDDAKTKEEAKTEKTKEVKFEQEDKGEQSEKRDEATDKVSIGSTETTTSHDPASARTESRGDDKSSMKSETQQSVDVEEKKESPRKDEKIDESDKAQDKSDDAGMEKEEEKSPADGKKDPVPHETPESKRGSITKDVASPEKKVDVEDKDEEKTGSPKRIDKQALDEQGQDPQAQSDAQIPGSEGFRYADESSSSSPGAAVRRTSRAATGGKRRGKQQQAPATTTGSSLLGSSEERSPDRSAIVAVIESPEWDDEDEEELDKEIREAVAGRGEEEDDDDEEDGSDGIAGEDDDVGIVRVLPSTSEEENAARGSAVDSLPQLQSKSQQRLVRLTSPRCQHLDPIGRMRRDSGGRDSGIEPSPRVSRIPRRTIKCCPNSERQRALHMETVTRDVQISLRRYHLERKIFFQLMELKRLQIRQGRANEQVLVKRLVDAFNKSGMTGPVLGVAKYDRPYTFRHFEMFLYEQLRKLQRRPATPDWCTEAKQCTQKTHRCHHATSAYTSVPIYTYLGGGGQERPSLLPKIEGRGRGQMTVEVTHGDEKQVIALPSEKIDHTKRYYVTFTVRGETTTDSDKPRTPSGSTMQRHTKSV